MFFLAYILGVSGFMVYKDYIHGNDEVMKKCDTVHQISGLFKLGRDQYRMFWLFEARNQSETAPLIVWLNGVPNQAPIFGTSAGMSPCLLSQDTTLVSNPLSWNRNANLLFFDMYNVTSNDRRFDKELNVKTFIHAFAEEYPKYVKNGIHIFAQSYDASTAVVAANIINRMAHTERRIHLLSVGIGNPIVDMQMQMLAYPKEFNKTVADSKEMNADIDRISSLCGICNGLRRYSECDELAMALSKCAFEPYLARDYQLLNTNGFDYDKLNAQIINSQKVFHRSPRLSEYASLRQPFPLSDSHFLPNKKRIFESIIQEIEKLVYYGVPVLVYAGADDYISSFYGLQIALKRITVGGKRVIGDHQLSFRFNPFTNQVAYLEQGTSGLTLAKVFNAGHLAQYDQPESLQLLIESWLYKTAT